MIDTIYDAEAVTRQGNAPFAVHIVDYKFDLPFLVRHIKSYDVIVLDGSDAFGAETFQIYPILAEMKVSVNASSHQGFVYKDSVFGVQGGQHRLGGDDECVGNEYTYE